MDGSPQAWFLPRRDRDGPKRVRIHGTRACVRRFCRRSWQLLPDVWFVGYRQHVIVAWRRCSPRAQAFISIGEALPFPPDTDDNCPLLSSIVATSDEASKLWALVRRSMLRRSMVYLRFRTSAP